MSATYSPGARIAFLVVKALGILFGLVASVVSVMSMVGMLVESGWVRLIVAAVVVMAPPLFLSDRLLPDNNAAPAPGLVSDVFALCWMVVPIVWPLLLHDISRPHLAREGDRLAAAEHPQFAELAYLLAGVDVKPHGSEPPPAAPAGSASGSAAPAASSAAPATSAPLSASASASAQAPKPPPGAEKSPAELFKQLAPSVVTIFVKGSNPSEEASGTGFLIDDKGTIATNHHVIAQGKTLTIKFHNGARFEAADLLVDSPAVDLALLDIDLEHPSDAGPRVDAKPLQLGDSEVVVVGERAISIGNPLGLEHTLTDGLVSARRMYEGKAWIQMSVPVSPGNSGGPLFNMKGEVIGITTRQVLGGMFNRAQNLNLAVPVNELKKLLAPSYPSRRKFGESGSNGGHWLSMRQPVVASLVFVGLVGSAITLAVRSRAPHVASLPVPTAAPSAPASASAPAQSSAALSPSGAPVGSAAPSGSAPAPAGSAPGAPLLDRPLRVAIHGWELAVPLVTANQGLDPSPQSEFAKLGLEVRLGVTDRLSAIENALARGGTDREGADIAVLPLPGFVAAYERLRALSPEIFFVVGWSTGRDALMASKELITGAPSGEVALAGDEGSSSAFLGLFALDAAGYAPPKLKLVPTTKASEAQASAVDRSSPFEAVHRQTLLSTADASRLIPYVAIAQHSLIERQGPALVAWARGWLAGQRQVQADPAAAARTVGGATGAPGPLPLLKGLGEMQASSLPDAVRALGLSGRGAVTVEALFQQNWRQWKGVGLLTTPAPEAAPISASIVTALARSEAAPQAPPPAPKFGADKGKPLLVYRQKEGEADDRALEATLGLLAGAFERSALRVTVKKGAAVDAARTKKLVESVQGTYDISPGRLIAGTKAPDKASATIEVFSPP